MRIMERPILATPDERQLPTLIGIGDARLSKKKSVFFNIKTEIWECMGFFFLFRNGRHAEQARRCTKRKQCKIARSNAFRKRARTTRIKEHPIPTNRGDMQPPILIEGWGMLTLRQPKLVFFNIKTGIWECIRFTSVWLWQWRNEAENMGTSVRT